jgi:cytochrome b subunit of formate dehydrogenase
MSHSTLQAPEGYEIITVERYNRSQRLHHWVHVIGMLVFFFTGLELFIQMYFIGDYFLTRTSHFTIGIFIGAWDLVYFPLILAKDNKLREIIPTPRDFLDLFIITLCYFRILPDSKYPHHDFYILEEKKYVMKYHPGQKILSVANIIVIFGMGVTGISLAEKVAPGAAGFFVPGFAIAISSILVSPLNFLFIDLRLIHFLGYLYFILTTLLHFYLAIIPANRNRLRGIVTGKEKLRIAKD